MKNQLRIEDGMVVFRFRLPGDNRPEVEVPLRPDRVAGWGSVYVPQLKIVVASWWGEELWHQQMAARLERDRATLEKWNQENSE